MRLENKPFTPAKKSATYRFQIGDESFHIGKQAGERLVLGEGKKFSELGVVFLFFDGLFGQQVEALASVKLGQDQADAYGERRHKTGPADNEESPFEQDSKHLYQVSLIIGCGWQI